MSAAKNYGRVIEYAPVEKNPETPTATGVLNASESEFPAAKKAGEEISSLYRIRFA